MILLTSSRIFKASEPACMRARDVTVHYLRLGKEKKHDGMQILCRDISACNEEGCKSWIYSRACSIS